MAESKDAGASANAEAKESKNTDNIDDMSDDDGVGKVLFLVDAVLLDDI
eukprot:CAMPEP_0114661596 /NCGR_PEP_ID=MMETSP0191-20121206/22861_1 /TAXON_ID=126664 /ORGANISM="Sorites sp." /LENGTH=48 /DNA_ID= /DNA_START= /DNA_END= /DNA_ORIENTATION=